MDYVMLKDVCTINMGQSPDSNSYNDDGDGVPFFQGNADFGERYPITRKWCTAPTKMAAPNDILISVRAPIGAMNYAKESCCIGRGLAALTPDKSKVSSEFIFWLMKCKNQELNSKGTGSTFKAIGRKVLEETLVPNITLEKQTEYSAILERVYAVIQARKTELQKLDELVKARFVELFGDCLSNPKGWKTKCLEDIAEVGSSKRVFVEELREDGIPFYRGTEVGALAEGKQITPELFITEQHYAELCKATGTPRIGDLLMPSICPDGRIWLVNTDKPFYFKDGRVLWVHAIDTSYNPVFLLYTLKDRIMTDYSSIASGTTFAELKIFALKKCQVFDVPITLQNEFAAFIKQTDKSKVVVQKALDEAQLLFDSLMQKYFG